MSSNATNPSNAPRRVLAIRLSAMGDVIHALPAVVRLKRSFPALRVTWAIEPRWAPLLDGNRFVDDVIEVPTKLWRRKPAAPATWSEMRLLRRCLRLGGFDAVIDFQGLLKSGFLARLASAPRVYGFESRVLREPLARMFYTHRVAAAAPHVVDKNLELAAALGASSGPAEFPLPPGTPQPELPGDDFVLASPVAGWKSKQWPPQYYARLASLLWRNARMTLLLDCAPADRAYCEQIRRLAPAGSCDLQVSSLGGLIAATRRARAVIGVDSGPLHLAAALGIGGVAIFGQTDPTRNGPYGDGFTVLRAPGVETSYKREDDLHPGMAAIEPEHVWEALEPRLVSQSPSPALENR